MYREVYDTEMEALHSPFSTRYFSFPFYLRFLSPLPFLFSSAPVFTPLALLLRRLVLSSRHVTRNKTRQQYSSLSFVPKFFAWSAALCIRHLY